MESGKTLRFTDDGDNSKCKLIKNVKTNNKPIITSKKQREKFP